MLNRITQNDSSLNKKISEDGEDEFLSLLEDEDARPDEIIFAKDELNHKKDMVSQAVGSLDDRETQIINERHLSENPKTLEVLKILLESPAKPAIIAPTIMTEEIAFVTDIKGVCKDGVTLQTT